MRHCWHRTGNWYTAGENGKWTEMVCCYCNVKMWAQRQFGVEAGHGRYAPRDKAVMVYRGEYDGECAAR